MNTKINVEGEREKRTTGGEDSEEEYLLVEPTLGIGLSGSVYHPNLLEFNLLTEVGPSWQRVTQDPPGGTSETTPTLQHYHANVDLLRRKPYATRFYADKDRSFRNFDFFNRGIVDGKSYGGNTGYAAGPVPFTLSAFHREEDISGTINGDESRDEDTYTFRARNDRGNAGSTDIAYFLHDFHRDQEGEPPESYTENAANLFDTETWGGGGWVRLQSSAIYHSQEGTSTDTERMSIRENLDLSHSRDLSSNYLYSFNHSTSGQVDSDTQYAVILVRHQLYESLTSVLDVHAWTESSQSPGSTYDATRYGAGVDESYRKRLGSRGRLSLGYGIIFDRERRETTGQALTVVDEQHTLTTGITTYLDHPNVVSVTSVTNTAGVLYTETLDYLVIPQGALTQISRVPTGQIPDGSVVLVSYTTVAPSSDVYSTITQSARARLELFDRLVALYGRWLLVDNRGGESLVLKNIDDKVVGAELSWRWLHAGAEYEDYGSNLSPFRATRLFQTLTFEPRDDCTLTLDFAQNRLESLDSGDTRRTRSYLGRLRARILRHLFFTAEGGVLTERGAGYDQDLTTARTTLDFSYGQMTAAAGYQYQDENYLGNKRVLHHYFLQAVRRF